MYPPVSLQVSAVLLPRYNKGNNASKQILRGEKKADESEEEDKETRWKERTAKGSDVLSIIWILSSS